MNHPKLSSRARVALGLGVLLLIALPAAQAADLPKRKAGLWELKTQMAGMPSVTGPIQVCVDPATDNLLQERAKEKASSNCSVMEVRRESTSRTVVHSVCKIEHATATTDAVMTGNFDSGYRNEMKMHYEPPLHGISDMRLIQDARWLGPCKPNQKPGEVILPNGNNINVQEIMNNPQIRQMMQQRNR